MTSSYICCDLPPFHALEETEKTLEKTSTNPSLSVPYFDLIPTTTQKIIDKQLFFKVLSKCVKTTADNVVTHVNKSVKSFSKKPYYSCQPHIDLTLNEYLPIRFFYTPEKIAEIFKCTEDQKISGNTHFTLLYETYLPLASLAFTSNALLHLFIKDLDKNGSKIYSNLAKMATIEYLLASGK